MPERPNARTCIFFKSGAEEAVKYYAEHIPETEIDGIMPVGPENKLVLFRIMGTHFTAMDGNEGFRPGPDHSIYIATHDQEETDRIWAALADGGEEGQCGWVRDRFGQYWQVIPTAMTHMLIDPDREAAARVQAAMLKMRKIDIATMEAAFRGGG